MFDNLTEQQVKPSGKRMQSHGAVRPAPYRATNENQMYSQAQANYGNPGQQARVQMIKPPMSQVNFGEFKTEYQSSSAQAQSKIKYVITQCVCHRFVSVTT